MRALTLIVVSLTACSSVTAAPLQIATFRADVTPPVGAPLGIGYTPAKEIVDPLQARGIVLLSDQKPVVLCAVDWIGLYNSGHDVFREALAKAAGTTRERVCVHCLHQHDAPFVDFTAEASLADQGLGGRLFDVTHARAAIDGAAQALAKALKDPRPVTHISIGKAKVEQVASNRRVQGPDGKVKAVRWSATKDAAVRGEPEGIIDPNVQLLGFWDGDKPLASITYYATHPQSYYNKGGVSCDFPGLARGIRDAELPDVAHIHFNGASGNVTAGKYNDGDPATRPVLSRRLAAGMKSAWDGAKKVPVASADLDYRVRPVALPPKASADRDALRAKLMDPKIGPGTKLSAASQLSWFDRCAAGHKIDLTCLHLGPAWVLHLPGELFIEYQLAAQKLRPNEPVLTAAYGDSGPWYVGTAVAYGQGGYEVSVSLVAPEVEAVLMDGIRELLK